MNDNNRKIIFNIFILSIRQNKSGSLVSEGCNPQKFIEKQTRCRNDSMFKSNVINSNG